ncbi:MinD/ParA family ATP-binding protein [Amycolatopsis sulphurea]|uniref:MinD/ParA family ATP-binding protein n=1 Tax=Amycolatopsis sulphurea TaxID=76022 RepID=UPI001FE49F91|nr:chromosome partitioning protein [Amycolatopsis sulphurea]
MTTFSVALAARWPAPTRALLVEADPSGGDVGTRFSLKSAPGLVSLAVAARRNDDRALVWQHTQALPGGLPVVAAPPDADRARAALSALADPATGVGILRTAASAPESVVIVDCGRIDAGSPAMSIVRSADAMILLTRAHADDLAHLARRLPAIGRWTAHPAMVLVGDGYSTAEVARELGVLPLGRVPNDPHGAAVLCGRPGPVRWGRSGPAHSALGQVAHKIAEMLISEHASPPALSQRLPATSQPMQVLRAVPGVPASPVSENGLRPAPAPLPPNHENTSRGGQAS